MKFTVLKRTATALIYGAAVISFISVSATGCTAEEYTDERYLEDGEGMHEDGEMSGKETVTVRFSVSETVPSSKAESAISNTSILLYRNGLLYARLDNGLEAEVIPGEEYTYYAVANTYVNDTPLNEEETAGWTVDVNPGEPDAFIMSACGEFTVIEDNMTVGIPLERTHSAIRFSVDDSAAKGLEISRVWIMQAATSVSLFRTSGAVSTNTGETASAAELEALNNGEEIILYVPENCQGILLPENTDSWAKIPDNLGYKSELCTYMEVQGEFSGEHELAGPVTYRFYLGQDAVSDFNIFRNTEYSVCLCPTRKAVTRPSWMVSARNVYADIPYILVDMDGNIKYDFHNKFSTYRHDAVWVKAIKGKDGYAVIGNEDGKSVLGLSSGLEDWEFYQPCTEEVHDIVFGKGKYMLAGSEGNIFVSEDGLRWSSYRLGSVESLDFTGDMFFAMDENTIYSSEDGLSWSSYRTEHRVNNAVYGDGEYLVTGNTGFVYRSGDGMTWTQHPVEYDMPESQELVYGNGVYIISSGTELHYSLDGIQWFQNTVYTNPYMVVDFHDGIFLAACHNRNTIEIYTSLDGRGWKRLKILSSSISGNISDVCIVL